MELEKTNFQNVLNLFKVPVDNDGEVLKKKKCYELLKEKLPNDLFLSIDDIFIQKEKIIISSSKNIALCELKCFYKQQLDMLFKGGKLLENNGVIQFILKN